MGLGFHQLRRRVCRGRDGAEAHLCEYAAHDDDSWRIPGWRHGKDAFAVRCLSSGGVPGDALFGRGGMYFSWRERLFVPRAEPVGSIARRIIAAADNVSARMASNGTLASDV